MLVEQPVDEGGDLGSLVVRAGVPVCRCGVLGHVPGGAAEGGRVLEERRPHRVEVVGGGADVGGQLAEPGGELVGLARVERAIEDEVEQGLAARGVARWADGRHLPVRVTDHARRWGGAGG